MYLTKLTMIDDDYEIFNLLHILNVKTLLENTFSSFFLPCRYLVTATVLTHIVDSPFNLPDMIALPG